MFLAVNLIRTSGSNAYALAAKNVMSRAGATAALCNYPLFFAG